MLAHVGHQGILKMKKLLREKVWFPGIEAEGKADDGQLYCMSSQWSRKPSSNLFRCPHYLQSHGIPYMWIFAARYPEAEIVNSTATKGTISK